MDQYSDVMQAQNAVTGCAALQDGEQVALIAYQVDTISNEAIAQAAASRNLAPDDLIAQNFLSLLADVHSAFLQDVQADGLPRDVSLELLWLSEAVENRPYAAEVSLYLLVRTIGDSQAEASMAANRLGALCERVLDECSYSFTRVALTDLAKAVAAVDDSAIAAVKKSERIEYLQTGEPFYAFDRLPEPIESIDRIVGMLHDHPACAVSVQLIPTTYTPEERMTLNMVNASIANMQQMMMGMSSQTLAPISDLYRYYSMAMNGPLYLFNLVIYGSEVDIAPLVSRVTGVMAGTQGAVAATRVVRLSSAEVNRINNFFPLPWAVNELLFAPEKNGAFWANPQMMAFQGCARMRDVITSTEAMRIFRIPSAEINLKHRVNTGGIPVGRIRSSVRGDRIELMPLDLAKHMLIVGTPGSGKTNFSVGLLDQLWHEHGIPFLVIEPAKTEYRALISSIPDLQVFTPGKDFISPFLMNPFVPPEGVRLQAYRSTLKTAFTAAVSMQTPLDKIFEDTIANSYAEHGWIDSYRLGDGGEVFDINEFNACFERTFERIGYQGEAQNIGRAGLLRLRGMTALFDNYGSIPISDLLTKPTVIELAAIENQEEKALIIALLLLQVLSYANANYVGTGDELKNFILLEEAHVLLGSNSNKQMGEADPAGIAKGLVIRMLAELRSLGVALAIADQSPRKVGVDVVSLTDVKLAFRLVEEEDRRTLANSTSMSSEQEQRLSRLQVGEAYVYYNKLSEPEEVMTPNYRVEHDIPVTISDEEIAARSTYWDSRGELLRPYPECAVCPGCQDGCDLYVRERARAVAQNLFRRTFTEKSADCNALKEYLQQGFYTQLMQVLGSKPSKRLAVCTLMHLLRNVEYGTKIRMSREEIEKLMTKLAMTLER